MIPNNRNGLQCESVCFVDCQERILLSRRSIDIIIIRQMMQLSAINNDHRSFCTVMPSLALNRRMAKRSILERTILIDPLLLRNIMNVKLAPKGLI